MRTCPVCLGDKVVTSFVGFNEASSGWSVECLTCGGTGKVADGKGACFVGRGSPLVHRGTVAYPDDDAIVYEECPIYSIGPKLVPVVVPVDWAVLGMPDEVPI